MSNEIKDLQVYEVYGEEVPSDEMFRIKCIGLINEFANLPGEKIEKYVDDGNWIPEDFWAGFDETIEGLIKWINSHE